MISIDDIKIFGDFVIQYICDIGSEESEIESKEKWNKIYEYLFGGFESLVCNEDDDDDEEDELDSIPKNRKTRDGYLKDGFVVDNAAGGESDVEVGDSDDSDESQDSSDDNSDESSDNDDFEGEGDGEDGVEDEFFNKKNKNTLVKNKLNKNKSLPHDISAKYKTAKIMIMPNKGKGLIAGSSARTILNLAGVNDVTSKFFSKTKNKLNKNESIYYSTNLQSL